MFETQEAVQVGLGQNPLRQAVADRRQPQHPADVERQIADPVSEGEQRFEGGKAAIAASRRQLGERIGEFLQIGETDAGERLPRPAAKPFHIGAIGTLGVERAAVEPEIEQLGVGGSLRMTGGDGQGVGRGQCGAHFGQRSTNAR